MVMKADNSPFFAALSMQPHLDKGLAGDGGWFVYSLGGQIYQKHDPGCLLAADGLLELLQDGQLDDVLRKLIKVFYGASMVLYLLESDDVPSSSLRKPLDQELTNSPLATFLRIRAPIIPRQSL